VGRHCAANTLPAADSSRQGKGVRPALPQLAHWLHFGRQAPAVLLLQLSPSQLLVLLPPASECCLKHVHAIRVAQLHATMWVPVCICA
jgi:hypothetical protein